jgi:hypothetical protein
VRREQTIKQHYNNIRTRGIKLLVRIKTLSFFRQNSPQYFRFPVKAAVA